MKKILLIWIFVLPFFVQAQLTDNFSDGDFTNNPTWSGDAADFTVNATQQLQLNSTAPNTSSLSVPDIHSSLDSLEWHFWIHLAFSPSSANYARVYLVSDQANLESSLNGYYVQFGEANSIDAIELFQQSGTTSTSVCRGTNGQIANAFTVGVRVVRDASGLWTLSVDPIGGTNYLFAASGTNVTTTTSAFMGVVCTYTISNATKYFFDDFYSGVLIRDTVAPVILSASALSDSTLDIKFNEQVGLLSSQTTSNYSVDNSISNPSTIQRDATDFSLVHLTFSSHFVEGTHYTITISGVKDNSNNAMGPGNTAQFTWYNPQQPDSGDVVINEVLFSARTGGKEFVEIYNRTSKAIYLKSLKFTRVDLATGLLDFPTLITTGNELLVPHGYMVLTDDPSIVKSQYHTEDPNAFITMNLPDLLTDEDILVLQDDSSHTMDQLHYYSSWHFPLLNDVHGVSLERLNPDKPTQDQSNWHSAAESVGFATPGYKNSQSDDSQNNGSEVSVDPEIFSPDNDGHNDVVNLHYHFSNPGNVANVNI